MKIQQIGFRMKNVNDLSAEVKCNFVILIELNPHLNLRVVTRNGLEVGSSTICVCVCVLCSPVYFSRDHVGVGLVAKLVSNSRNPSGL